MGYYMWMGRTPDMVPSKQEELGLLSSPNRGVRSLTIIQILLRIFSLHMA